MQINLNSKDMFTMKKFLSSQVNQQRFFRKKTDQKSCEQYQPQELGKEQQFPPIIARIAQKIENINFKYKSRHLTEKRRNHRKVSLPVLKYSPSENAEQLRLIKRLLDSTPQRIAVKDDTLKLNMIGYSKVSTLMMG